MMARRKQAEGFRRWAMAVRARVEGHPFVAPQETDGKSLLDQLLERIYQKHFLSTYAHIEPPLPDFPPMPLQHDHWIELRLSHTHIGLPFGRKESGPFARRKNSVHRLMQTSETVLILGAPGSGKSTLLRWAARYLIEEPRIASLIPVYIQLRSYARWRQKRPTGTLFEFFWEIQLGLPRRHSESFQGFVEEMEGSDEARRSLFRMLLDGWDEVSYEDRGELIDEFERFEYALPTVLTSRPISPPSHLPRWTRYEIEPLTFESMIALMRRWFALVKRWELEQPLIAHLDRQLGLRELARNPFVLTLVCAVAANKGGYIPETRSALYHEAMGFIRQYYNTNKASKRLLFNEDRLSRSADIAYKLLERKIPSPYEFTRDDVKRISHDGGALHTMWDRSRLIAVSNEHEGAFAFLHATLHEFLASTALVERLASAGAEADMPDLSHSGSFSTAVFAVGGAEGQVLEKVVSWLRHYCEQRDRFGIQLVQAARLAAERRDDPSGKTLVGFDLRPELWELFIKAPVPQFYVDAMIELDSEFAIDQFMNVQEAERALLPRFVFFFQRVQMYHPQRRAEMLRAPVFRGVVNHATMLDLLGKKSETSDGVRFDECWSLTEAAALPSVKDAIATARRLPPSRISIQTLRNIGRSRTHEAESFLIEKFWRSKKHAGRFLSALGDLATPGARDVLVEFLDRGKSDRSMILPTLRALQGIPLKEGAEKVLGLVSAENELEVRTVAASVLGSCDRSDVLNKLSDYALLTEPEGEVRKAVIKALSAARCVTLVRPLLRELATPRQDLDEQRAIWTYLGVMAHTAFSTRDHAHLLPAIERLFISALDNASVPDAVLLGQCGEMRGSIAIQERLIGIVRNQDVRSGLRGLAIRALDVLNMPLEQPECVQLLRLGLDNSSLAELAQACADSLAMRAPELLLSFDSPIVVNALWRMSLITGTLVYFDRVEQPGRSQNVHSSEFPKPEKDVDAMIQNQPKFRRAKRKPGRKYARSEGYDEKLAKDYQASGLTKKEFAFERKIPYPQVVLALDAARKQPKKRK